MQSFYSVMGSTNLKCHRSHTYYLKQKLLQLNVSHWQGPNAIFILNIKYNILHTPCNKDSIKHIFVHIIVYIIVHITVHSI